MIICAALGANWCKYHNVSQLHPLDDYVLGVPALLANGHAHGTLYECTCIGTSTMRNLKRNNKYLFYPQTMAEYLARAPANKKICHTIMKTITLWLLEGYGLMRQGPRAMTTRNVNKQQPTQNTPAWWRRKRRGDGTGGERGGSALCYDFFRGFWLQRWRWEYHTLIVWCWK